MNICQKLRARQLDREQIESFTSTAISRAQASRKLAQENLQPYDLSRVSAGMSWREAFIILGGYFGSTLIN